MRPVYTEVSSGDPDAWLERDGKRLPLRRILESSVDPTTASPIHPTVDLYQLLLILTRWGIPESAWI
jgi:hypothetical protein